MTAPAPITETHSSARKRKRGFTLTEIAIVLGIIGLILGAIWVAAAAVYNNLRTSKATTELLQITQAVRAMYSTSTLVDSAATTANYVSAGVFPSDMTNAGTATTATNPWGGYVTITAGTVSTTNDAFNVTFGGVPASGCISMITRNTGPGRDTGLSNVAVGTSTGNAVTVTVNANANFNGINASTAAGSCITAGSGAAAGNAVGFLFRLKG